MSTRPLPRRRALAVWIVVLSSLALVFAPRAASAQKKAEAPRVAYYGTGPDLKPAKEAVKRLLPDGVELDQGRFTKELQKGGPLGPEFDKSPRLGKRVEKAIAKSKVEAAVLARTYRKKKDRMVHVLVFVPGSAEPEVDATVKLGKKDSESEWVELNDAVFPVLSKLEPEPEPEPEPVAAKPAKGKAKGSAKSEAKSKKGAAKKPPPEEEEAQEEAEEEEAAAEEEEPEEEAEAVEEDAKPADEDAKPDSDSAAKDFDRNAAFAILGLALGVGGRDFAYNDAVSPALRDYSAGNLFSIGARLELYPLAGSAGFARNIGLAAKLDWALPAKSKGVDGQEFDASYSAFEVGLRYRIPLGRSALGVGAGFGKESFSFSDAGEPYNEIAGVDYSYLRLGVDGRFALGPVALLAGLGYRMVLSGGTVADNFTDTSITGLDARLGVALPLGERFEAFLALRYARYGYGMSPRPEDTNVAGGALDQFFALELGGSMGF